MSNIFSLFVSAMGQMGESLGTQEYVKYVSIVRWCDGSDGRGTCLSAWERVKYISNVRGVMGWMGED